MKTFEINSRLEGFSCLRCGRRYARDNGVVDLGVGCVSCLEEGFPANLRVDYSSDSGWQERRSSEGMKCYGAFLPYDDFHTLGEGMTPLVELTGQAEMMRVGSLWIKNEGQNPTGSHKDRMSVLAVARAASLGRDAVVASSSGNAGASLAAYAGAAGLRCAIISTREISTAWARAIKMAGADLNIKGGSLERWQTMQRMVEKENWYPVTNYLNPPVGSNLFGIQGYKTISYEIIEQSRGDIPTVIMVPTSRGDLLWGIWEGLADLKRYGVIEKLPRLVAIEPIPRLSKVLSGEDYRQLFEGESHEMPSIGGGTVTYQSVEALLETEGCAVEVSNDEAVEAQRELAQIGFYAELSSAASYAGLKELVRRGEIDRTDRVVLILTSHGYKDLPEDA